MTRQVSLFLDSGAFTAFTKGEVIDLSAYADYVIANAREVEDCINLDVIPGEYGKPRSQAEVDASAAASRANWLSLKNDYGIDTWPVFHYGEDFDWLLKILDDTDKVCISPGKKGRAALAFAWFDRVFKLALDANPDVRLHGLGVFQVERLFAYPWASVDSSYWLYPGNYGCVLIPRRTASGEYDYTQTPVTFGIARGKDRIHLRNQGEATQGYLEDYFVSEGFQVADLAENREARQALTLCFYHNVEAALRKAGHSTVLYHCGATGGDPILTEFESRHRMVSYFFVRQHARLAHYVTTGDFR